MGNIFLSSRWWYSYCICRWQCRWFKAITNANDEGTFTSLIIDDEQDYNSFDANGNTVAVNNRIYAPYHSKVIKLEYLRVVSVQDYILINYNQLQENTNTLNL